MPWTSSSGFEAAEAGAGDFLLGCLVEKSLDLAAGFVELDDEPVRLDGGAPVAHVECGTLGLAFDHFKDAVAVGWDRLAQKRTSRLGLSTRVTG